LLLKVFFFEIYLIEYFVIKNYIILQFKYIIPIGLYHYPNFIGFDDYPSLSAVIILLSRTLKIFFIFLMYAITFFFMKVLFLVLFCILFFPIIYITNIYFLSDEIGIINLRNYVFLSPNQLKFTVLKTRRERRDEELLKRFAKRVEEAGGATKYIEKHFNFKK
jgi:hypothetical protein